jgi:outer membrane immunogenic protein
MKRIPLVLAFAVLAGPALAADVIYDEPPAPAPVDLAPAAGWTGFYVGGQAGVAGGGSTGASGVDGFGAPTDTFQRDTDVGFTGGAHAGYDYQMQNGVILGGVADINYIDHDKKSGVILGDGTAGGAGYTTKTDVEYFGTVRGKVGYGMDRVAVYGTGGLAYGKVKVRPDSGNFTDAVGTLYTADTDTDKDSVGYTVGAGVDVLATDNVSFGVEYLYTDLGKAKSDTTFTAANPAPGVAPDTFSTKTRTDVDFHTVMAKGSYRFN